MLKALTSQKDRAWFIFLCQQKTNIVTLTPIFIRLWLPFLTAQRVQILRTHNGRKEKQHSYIEKCCNNVQVSQFFYCNLILVNIRGEGKKKTTKFLHPISFKNCEQPHLVFAFNQFLSTDLLKWYVSIYLGCVAWYILEVIFCTIQLSRIGNLDHILVYGKLLHLCVKKV